MACLCVRVYNYHSSSFPKATNFPLYVNTSVHYECFKAFFNVSVLKEVYIHSTCTFKKTPFMAFVLLIFHLLSL